MVTANAGEGLERIRRELEASGREGATLLSDAGPERASARPATGGWSASECLEHLNATARVHLELVAAALETARRRGWTSEAPGRVRPWMQPLIRGMEPPVKLRVKTRRDFVPPAELDPERVAADFRALHERVLTQLDALGGCDLNRPHVRSPFMPLLRYRLWEWLLLYAAHERRHLWQARQALAEASAAEGTP